MASAIKISGRFFNVFSGGCVVVHSILSENASKWLLQLKLVYHSVNWPECIRFSSKEKDTLVVLVLAMPGDSNGATFIAFFYVSTGELNQR